MRQVFGKGVQVAFKRHRNIREFLCRAKLYPKVDRRNPPRAVQTGWRRCNRCLTCEHSQNKSEFKVTATKERRNINQDINCKTCQIIYVVECSKCPNHPQYIGKTKRSLMARGREHLGNIQKLRSEGKSTSKMYEHFSTNGHTTRDFLIFGIEQVFGDEFTLRARERYYIDTCDTVRNGLNTYRT